jgi:hypothetical protein
MARKKIIGLENRDQALAFARFLIIERRRHIQDIVNITRDLDKLAGKWKIDLRELTYEDAGIDIWIEV